MGIFYSDKIINAYLPKVTKSTSRYKTKLRLSTQSSTKIRFIRKADVTFDDTNSKVHVVGQFEAYRPDLISYQYYGSSIYSWVILAANNLKTSYELSPGLSLVIPSLSSLQGSKGKLVTR